MAALARHFHQTRGIMPEAKLKNLREFTGTENWYRHALNRHVTFTDCAKYVADEAGAYWLLDEIVLAQAYVKAVENEAFQVWELKVANDKATLDCDDGDGNVVFTKEIAFTDFPEPGIKLYFTDNVILLPSEY
jgi:hypothetical protein